MPAYHGVRQVLGSVYRPINKVVNKVADGVLSVDKFIQSATDHPVLRDLAGVLINNPIYKEIINLTKDVRDAVNYAGDFSNVLDKSIDRKLKRDLVKDPPSMEELSGTVFSEINKD